MANRRQRPDPSGFTAENEIDLVLGSANPNPERTGCPSREVLTALASRERLADDPAYEHLIKCSPCYREVRALQQAAGERRVATVLSRGWLAAAAAVVILGVLAAWLVSRQPADTPTAPAATAIESPEELSARLDLRKFSVTRSDEKPSAAEPISLPRGRLNLTLLLPVGYEGGQYDVQLLDSDLTSRASSTGKAEISDFVATLRAGLDTAGLPAGTYQLAVRRHGESWQMFPVELN
jgi:hypothetical protein